MKNAEFVGKMTLAEKEAWLSFKEVIENFLGNHRSPHYEEIVQRLLANLRTLNINMSYKIHFLHAHLNRFTYNCGDFSEEQGERFHQDIKSIEQRYKGRWDISMMADYCWALMREETAKPSRKCLKRSIDSSNK